MISRNQSVWVRGHWSVITSAITRPAKGLFRHYLTALFAGHATPPRHRAEESEFYGPQRPPLARESVNGSSEMTRKPLLFEQWASDRCRQGQDRHLTRYETHATRIVPVPVQNFGGSGPVEHVTWPNTRYPGLWLGSGPTSRSRFESQPADGHPRDGKDGYPFLSFCCLCGGETVTIQSIVR
jgi:hypothetical protein